MDNETNVAVDEAQTVISTIFLPAVLSLVVVVGLFGNGLVIYIMQFKVRQKSITDIYVTNLAVADFIFILMLPFWTVDMALSRRWIFGRAFCKLVSGSTYIHMYASIFFLIAMSIDRLIAVVFFSTCTRTRKMAVSGSIGIWLISASLSVLPFYFRDIVYFKHNDPSSLVNQTEFTMCDWTFGDSPQDKMWMTLHLIIRKTIGFIIPLFIITCSYLTIALFLKSRKTVGRLTSQRQDRATALVLVVIAVFLVCWLPNQISDFIYGLQGLQHTEEEPTNSTEVSASQSATDRALHYYIHIISIILAWGHSCVNPILYAFMREDIKLKITEILHTLSKSCCGRKFLGKSGRNKVELNLESKASQHNELLLQVTVNENIRTTTITTPVMNRTNIEQAQRYAAAECNAHH